MFFDIPAPHGHLEALRWDVTNPKALALICHPHPQFGGTMHSHVPYRMAVALRRLGATTVRFNFRGVGRSTGRFAEGVGEQEDVRSALTFMSLDGNRKQALPLLLSGFSFGAWVGLQVGIADDRVDALLGVGLPVNTWNCDFLRAAEKPFGLIQAEHDEYGQIDTLRGVVGSAPGLIGLLTVPGASHLFPEKLDELEAAVTALIPRILPQLTPG